MDNINKYIKERMNVWTMNNTNSLNYISRGLIITSDDNVSKSKLLFNFLSENETVYFIDIMNRDIDDMPGTEPISKMDSSEIRRVRLQPNNFNKRDTVGSLETSRAIRSELNRECYINWFRDLSTTNLANRALIRILIESIYAIEQGAQYVAIDQPELYLAPSQIKELMQRLEYHCPCTNFIMTTNSPYLLMYARDFDIAYVTEDTCSIINGNNIIDFVDIERNIPSMCENNTGQKVYMQGLDTALNKIEDKLDRGINPSQEEINFIKNMRYCDDILNEDRKSILERIELL